MEIEDITDPTPAPPLQGRGVIRDRQKVPTPKIVKNRMLRRYRKIKEDKRR